MPQSRIPLYSGIQIADTANTANAAVVRDTDGSINVGQANVASLNNAGASYDGDIVTVTASSYTVLGTDRTILCDCTSNAVTINLPAVAASEGRKLEIKKIDSSGNAVTIDASGSETIDGATTKTLSSQWASRSIKTNGTAWFIIAQL